MDRILISLKKENGPRASSTPALGLNTIIFKHVYWYMQQTKVSVYRTIGPLVYLFCYQINLNTNSSDRSSIETAITVIRKIYVRSEKLLFSLGPIKHPFLMQVKLLSNSISKIGLTLS